MPGNYQTLFKSRSLAFERQRGRCFYCNAPMWLTDLNAFCIRHELKPRSARPLQCTAEHVTARCDGGSDRPENILAACWLCNQRRHRRPAPPDATTYLALVRKRLRAGKWHGSELVRRL